MTRFLNRLPTGGKKWLYPVRYIFLPTQSNNNNIGKTMVEGSCLGGIAIPDNADYYATAQAGTDYYLGMSTEKTCKKYAKAWKNAIAQNGESNDGDYTEESFLASLTEFSGCQPNADKDTEWFAVRCGASFTGSSMAAVFGLLSVALALW